MLERRKGVVDTKGTTQSDEKVIAKKDGTATDRTLTEKKETQVDKENSAAGAAAAS